MEAPRAQTFGDARHAGRMRHRREWIRPTVRRLGGIVADRAPNSVKTLRAVVVRRERLVVDRPRRRDAVGVFHGVKIFTPQPVENAAPELRVAADVVMGVGLKLAPGFIEPSLASAVTQVLPDRFRAP